MFENRVLRRIFGPRKDKVTGEWRKLHNEELNYLYSSLSSVRVTKWRRMRWAKACSTYGGRAEAYTGFWWGNLRERDHLGKQGVDRRIILRWIFRKRDVGGKDLIELAQDTDSWRARVNAVMKLRAP